MHAEGGAAPRVGVPGALGEQAHRRARYGDARPRTDEPAECARLADVARLSVAPAEVGALTVHGCERLGAECTTGNATRTALQSARDLCPHDSEQQAVACIVLDGQHL